MLSRRTFLVSTLAGVVRPWGAIGRFAPPDLAILHTNDVHGRVAVEGEVQGLAFLAAEIRRQRRLYPVSLTLDAGDIIHGTPMESLHGPSPVLEAFNAIGYDGATVGNHEFDFGPENLRRAARLARFPLLSANVRDRSGAPWGPLIPYRIFERGGRRIGIFGLTTLETPKIQWPRTIEDIRFEEPYDHARKMVAELRPKVDLLICLSHLGYKADLELAHEAKGIDLIVGGHSHTRLTEAKVENGVTIVQTGCFGKALGRIEVRFDGKTPQFDYALIDATAGEDGEVEKVYGPYADRLKGELAEILATIPAPMSFDKLTRERPEARFLAESVRKAHEVDVGLFAASQISGEWAAGPVARKDAYRVMAAYTRQHIVRMGAPEELVRTKMASAPGVLVAGEPKGMTSVAGPAHVMQDLFLDQPGTEIVYDDPLGPTVRDAVMKGLQARLFSL